MSNTLLQPAAFLTLLYGGAATGILYDGFRLIRRIFRGRLLCSLCDGLFVLGATGLLFASLFFATGGEARVYLLLGFVCGFFLEQWSLSSLFFNLFHSILARKWML
ncbi:MAG TPA: spore cortex biosynthesis protein YabQ [Feifaniaceae bacterium]|nr:spore cortex biosynthesis protein YabQ [Feifaniaceae bacterium]